MLEKDCKKGFYEPVSDNSNFGQTWLSAYQVFFSFLLFLLRFSFQGPDMLLPLI